MIMFATVVLLVVCVLALILAFEQGQGGFKYIFGAQSLATFLIILFIAIPALEGRL